MTSWFRLPQLFRPEPPRPSDWPPPPEIEDDEETLPSRPLSPTAAPVHVLSGNALVRVKDHSLLVERPEQPTFDRPIELVSAVHIHGWSGITSPAVAQLLAQGTPVVWRGLNGYPIGCSMPMTLLFLRRRSTRLFRLRSGWSISSTAEASSSTPRNRAWWRQEKISVFWAGA